MTDPTQDFQPLDMGRINTADPLEMEYWCREIGCTETALNEAVAAVGTHVAAVREHLRSAPAR